MCCLLDYQVHDLLPCLQVTNNIHEGAQVLFFQLFISLDPFFSKMSLLHKWASQRLWWWMISRTFCLISTKQVQVHVLFILMVGQFLLAKTSKHRLIIPCGLWITLLTCHNRKRSTTKHFIWKFENHNKEKLPTITLCPNMYSLETLSSLSYVSVQKSSWW